MYASDILILCLPGFRVLKRGSFASSDCVLHFLKGSNPSG